jgi:hypothetical protein
VITDSVLDVGFWNKCYGTEPTSASPAIADVRGRELYVCNGSETDIDVVGEDVCSAVNIGSQGAMKPLCQQ